jgi:hypothetical protein
MENVQYCDSFNHPSDLIITCHCIYQLSLQINLSGTLDDVIRIKLMRFAKKLIVTSWRRNLTPFMKPCSTRSRHWTLSSLECIKPTLTPPIFNIYFINILPSTPWSPLTGVFQICLEIFPLRNAFYMSHRTLPQFDNFDNINCKLCIIMTHLFLTQATAACRRS